MLVIPAIDLRGGKCVRMRQGDPSTTAAYDDDPVERAAEFVAEGARRLHVIDLDGAFGSGENLAAVQAICAAVDVPVQMGGGLRNLKHAETAFAAGVSEIILGTLLVEDERLARHIAGRFPGKVIAGIDARGSSYIGMISMVSPRTRKVPRVKARSFRAYACRPACAAACPARWCRRA